MSFWYDANKKEYASDGRNGWIKAYCIKLCNDVKTYMLETAEGLQDMLQKHFSGFANRHSADHIDYNSKETVKEKIDSLSSAISSEAESRKSAIGSLSGLKTTAKNNVVSSINEMYDYTVNKVYDIDISKVGSGNDTLYIQMDGITDYSQLTGRAVAIYTSSYQCRFSSPSNIYVNVNSLGNKALRRPITGDYTDYDSKQYYTDKFCGGEIGRYQTLLVLYNGTQFVLLNVAVPPKATKNIEEGSTDNTSFVTPKAVAQVTDALSNRINTVDNSKAAKQTSGGGFEGGSAASIGTSEGAAIGKSASATNGGAAGSSAAAESGGAAGYLAKTSNGFAGGNSAYSSWGAAVGSCAKAGDGFSGGKNAQVKNVGSGDNLAYIDAIQLGTGTNVIPKTMQVYSKRIVESDGSLTDVGKLSTLETSNKNNIVAAINELKTTSYNEAPSVKFVNNDEDSTHCLFEYSGNTITGTLRMPNSYIVFPYTNNTLSCGELELKPFVADHEFELEEFSSYALYVHTDFAGTQAYAYTTPYPQVHNTRITQDGIDFRIANMDLYFEADAHVYVDIVAFLETKISGWEVLPYYLDSIKNN